MSQSLRSIGSNFAFHWQLEARRLERVQQAVCGGPAEPEDPVCTEAALPEGGGGGALPLPREHAHSGPGLQQPRLPPGVEPRALVSGNRVRHGATGLVPQEKGR